MTDKVINTVKKHNMISKGDSVGVGVSGGADSVSLLCFLVKNKELLGIKSITAVHINHSIRGAEADRDMLFTQKLCESLAVQCKIFTVDVPAEAKKTGESLETCARRMRYEIFESLGFGKFATAHNLNDRMETFFWNLARGTSASGLLSIPYVRGIYIRPLLDCTREEIEEYLNENGLTYITDSTNNSDEYTRNKIRHSIVPLMYELNPSFPKAFLKCEDALETDNAFLDNMANQLLNDCRNGETYNSEPLKNAPEAVRHRAIAAMLKSRKLKSVMREHILLVDKIIFSGGFASVCGDTVKCERGTVSFGTNSDIPDFSIEIKNFTDEVKTPCGNFKISNSAKKDLQNVNKRDFNNWIDRDKIIGQLKVRSRKPGDSVKLKRNGMTKTLKNLFNEKKIPVSKRPEVAIVSDDEGIVWLEGFGVSERCAVTLETEQAIKFNRTGEQNEK